MKQAQLFDATMSVIWGNVPEPNLPATAVHAEPGKVARALASYVKNHRLNAENGFDVLGLLWPDAEMTARLHFTRASDDESEAWFDVKFPDGSIVLLISHRGICDSIEVVSLDDAVAGESAGRA